MSPSLVVRPATEADHDWLFSLHESAHRRLVERAYGPWDPVQQQGFFLPLIRDHEVFVVEEGEHPVGACYLGIRDDDAWLELLEIAPEHQGRGLGSAALQWVVRRSREADLGTLLQVHKVNDGALRLYLRSGFACVGQTESHHLLRHP